MNSASARSVGASCRVTRSGASSTTDLEPGPEPRPADHLRRQGDDVSIGAIVAGQPHDPGSREVTAELREEPHVRAPEAVDGLVRVADGAEVGVRPDELLQEPDLLLVDVLVLVDRDPPVLPPVPRANPGVGFQHVRRPQDEIVEIAQVGGLHRSLVCLQHFSRHFLRRRPAGALRARDGREPTTRPPLGDIERVPQQPDPLGLRSNPEPRAAGPPRCGARSGWTGPESGTCAARPAPMRRAGEPAGGRASRRRRGA